MKADNAKVVLILHNLRSAHNVGSIFRTADTIGVRKICLTGYTPPPVDQFGRVNKEIAKTALGAERALPWERGPEIGKIISNFKESNFQIIALEQSKNSVDYKTINVRRPDVAQVAVILGNELSGLDQKILGQCDIVAEIPMRGGKESLNVSVAAGIFLFRLLDY